MAKKFLTSIDLSKCELLNASIHNLAAAPNSPADGQVYFNTGDGQMYYYNGSAWQSMSGDITSVEIIAAGGLTGDSSTTNGAFSATLAVGAGTGITVNANDVAIKNAANLSHFYLTKWDALGGNQLASSVIADDGTDAFVYGALDVSDGFTVATDKFVVTATGNVTAAGTLGVAGNTTLSGTLGVTGATTLSSTLGVSGATTLSDTLSVTGTSTLTGAVTTGAGLTVGTNLAVTANTDIGGTLNVGGIGDFGSDLIVRGDLTVIGASTNVVFESTTVQLGDAYLTLNEGHDRQLPAATDAGWVVIRSEVEGNISVLWSEGNDKFVFANVGNEDGTTAPAGVSWGTTVDILANNIEAEGTLTIGNVTGDDTATVIGVNGSGVVKSISTSSIVASGITFQFSDDGGAATALGATSTLTINSGEGLNTSGTGSTITISAEDATTTNKGIVELATGTETNGLSDTARAVTPASLASLRYAANVPATAGGTVTIPHGLNSMDVIVQVYELATMQTVDCDVSRLSPTDIELGFCNDYAADTFRVLVIKVA